MYKTLFTAVSLSLAIAVSAFAQNTCTPLNYPATGPFPAIVSGIDAVDWGVARVQWTSNSFPVTQQKIQYATASEWSSAAGVYPHTQGLQTQFNVTSSTWLQGSVLPNLQPSTTYHVIGQSWDGSTWCTATDETFTTLPKPSGTTIPAHAKTFSAAIPTPTGTTWTYGSNCGTGSDTTSNVQACINAASPGDIIKFPPATYNVGKIYLPVNSNAVTVTCAAGTPGTCTQSGSAPTNGTKIRFGYQILGSAVIPTPIQPEVTYTVIGSSGSTFNVSYDGVTALPFTASSAPTIYYWVYPPVSPQYITFTTTAAASSLPPAGVRTDPSYASALPNFQLNDPGESFPIFNSLSSYWYFSNIEISVDPAIVTKSGNGVDPAPLQTPISVSNQNDHIVFNQIYFPMPSPSRVHFWEMDGSNIAVVNSYIDGIDYWQPFRTIPSPIVTSTSITFAAGSFSWVGSGGTKQTCTVTGTPSLTSISGTGSYKIWVDPTNCHIVAQLQTGLTATASGITASTVASPAFPTYSWTSSSGNNTTGWNVLTLEDCNVSSGVNSCTDDYGLDTGNTEGAIGFHVSSGPGPVMLVNNYARGSGVFGLFLSDDGTNGNSPCGNVNPCPVYYNSGNYTEQRNNFSANPCHSYDAACWDGGDYSWRNMTEVKQGKWVTQDGNVYGPYYTQISQGECGASHFTYNAGFLSTGYPAYADSSEWTFTNNTCYQTASGGIYNGFSYGALWFPLPMKNSYVHNNLFFKNNAYAQTAANSPLNSVITKNNSVPGGCPYGKLMQWGSNGQNFLFDHNTIYGSGGCLTWFFDQYTTLSAGMGVTNNVINLVSDPGVNNSVLGTGTFYQSNGTFGGTNDNPNCAGFQGSVLLSCLENFNWAGNVILASWTNSMPGSQVDYTNAQITTAQALFPSNTYFPTTGSTYANRLSGMYWFDPSNQNLRFNHQSPWISGASGGPKSTDGLDVGVDQDALESAQGKVSNVHAFSLSSTGVTIGFLAPDSFACSVDVDPSSDSGAFTPGVFTRTPGSGGQRVQNVAISGLTAHGLYSFRINCAVQQPKLTVQLP